MLFFLILNWLNYSSTYYNWLHHQKDVFLRIHNIITKYRSSRFSDNVLITSEKHSLVSFVIPPIIEKKSNGAKLLFWTCRIHLPYFCFFFILLDLQDCWRFFFHTLGVWVQNTYIKKTSFGISSKTFLD